jgi:transcriptional antiterminator NusG
MKLLQDAFSPEVMAELARPVQVFDPRFAEIIEGKTPRWCVVEVFAQLQAEVVKDLVERRFGVYVPEVDETVVRRGRKFDRRVPMFAGYVFVFMWYSDQHRHWITNTPGVIAIVGALTDAEVDIVREIENRERPVTIQMPSVADAAEPAPRRKSKSKRRWKKGKSNKAKAAKSKVITEADLRNQIITTRAWSAFDDIPALDSEQRNQTLMRALGLS